MRLIFGWRPRASDITIVASGLSEIAVDVGIRALVDIRKREFTVISALPLGEDEYNHVVFDLLVPRLIALDGKMVIHGGLVHLDDVAIGFLGASGRGKSTLTASIQKCGAQLMGDDAFILTDDKIRYCATRIFPSLRLFPDSYKKIMPKAKSLGLMAAYSKKERISFLEGPDTASLLCLFQIAEPDSSIHIRRLSAAEACMAIIANSFSYDILDIVETQKKFKLATNASQIIPVYDLHYPRDYDRLPEVHAAIFETLGLSLPEHTTA